MVVELICPYLVVGFFFQALCVAYELAHINDCILAATSLCNQYTEDTSDIPVHGGQDFGL